MELPLPRQPVFPPATIPIFAARLHAYKPTTKRYDRAAMPTSPRHPIRLGTKDEIPALAVSAAG